MMNTMMIMNPKFNSSEISLPAKTNAKSIENFQSFLQFNQTAITGNQALKPTVRLNPELLALNESGSLPELIEMIGWENAEEVVERMIPVTSIQKTEEISGMADFIEILEEENVPVNTIIENDVSSSEVDEQVYQQIIVFVKEMTNLMNDHSLPTDVQDKASRLLSVLQQWSTLKQQVNEEQLNRMTKSELTDKEAEIWKHLVSTFEKRTQFTNQQIYQAESSITKADVMNWLQNAFQLYQQPNETFTVHSTLNQSVPISEVEQYTIHVNQLHRVERLSDEILLKFQNIIRESRFIQSANTGNQLSIMLQPENLGTMTVRLMQIDGELTVKIMVTTMAAKEMLESNIHQLKHIFSPHQVLIERDETVIEEEVLIKEDETNEKEESMQQFDDADEEKDTQSTEESFHDWLKQVSEGEVMNE